MYRARDHRTGQIIAPSKASRYGTYRCQTCNAEVFLRDGSYRAAHFAHMPGQGKPECEEFHSSEDLRHVWGNSSNQRHGPAVEPLQLSIELEPQYGSRRGPRKWDLRLTVPKSHDSKGQVWIDLGGGDIRRIPLSTLALKPQSYAANPFAIDFGANKVSPEVWPEYRAAVEYRIAGLDDQAANVFCISQHKLKPKCKLLHWGESYYFVWHKSQSISIPQNILHIALADNRGWLCALIALPANADAEIAEWLARTCSLPIASSKKEWSLVYPSAYGIDDEGNLQVPSAAQILIAYRGASEDSSKLTCMSGQQSGATHLKGPESHLIEISALDHIELRPMYLTIDNILIASLIQKAPSPVVVDPSVVLEYGVGAGKSAIPFNRPAAGAFLQQMRKSGSGLSSIQGPPPLRGQFLWRGRDQLNWEVEALSFTEPVVSKTGICASLAPNQLSLINTCLQDRTLDVKLDFGAFGQFTEYGTPTHDACSAPISIAREVRAQIEWLCKSAGIYVSSKQRALSALDDEELVQVFIGLEVPSDLTVHWRVLRKQLVSPNRVAPR